MPIFNGINTDRLERFARRLLGIRQGGIMPSLSPEPAVSVDLPFTPDLLALSGAVPWGAGVVVGAVAAQFGAVRIANNLTNALLCYRASCGSGAGVIRTTHAVGNPGGAIGLAALGPAFMGYQDVRRLSTAFPLGIGIETGTVAAVPVAGFNVVGITLTAINVLEPGPWIVLPPGASALAYCEVANTSFACSLDGILRDVLPDELSGV